MTFRRFIGPALSAFLFACSSAPTAATAPAADAGSDVAPTAQCAAAAPSKCAVPNQGSVVRGRVTFDSSHFAAGAKVSLSIALNHQFALFKNEKLSGGHPHGTVYLKDVDVSSGAVPFSIDLCELGVAMWSGRTAASIWSPSSTRPATTIRTGQHRARPRRGSWPG